MPGTALPVQVLAGMTGATRPRRLPRTPRAGHSSAVAKGYRERLSRPKASYPDNSTEALAGRRYAKRAILEIGIEVLEMP